MYDFKGQYSDMALQALSSIMGQYIEETALPKWDTAESVSNFMSQNSFNSVSH